MPMNNNTTASSSMRRPISMEEVWKDITLVSDLRATGTTSSAVILQDFFQKDHPSPAVVSSSSNPAPPTTLLTLSSALSDLPSLVFPPPPPPPPPPLQHSIPTSSATAHALNVPTLNVDDNAAVGKKRFSDCGRNSGDRRQKRMIKNRESAARSRARKQAYTNELELEVAHLLEENARLREQQQLYRAAAAEDEKRRPLLHRTSTAPF